MHCLQAKPYKYTCYSCQAAVTSELANGLLHVLGKDYFMLNKILCDFITAHSPFKRITAPFAKRLKGYLYREVNFNSLNIYTPVYACFHQSFKATYSLTFYPPILLHCTIQIFLKI